MSTDALVAAIDREVASCDAAMGRLHDLADDSPVTEEVYALTGRLRTSLELMRCLRRLVAGRTVAELHRAFGAPGDWGYETPVGEALARLYRGEGDG